MSVVVDELVNELIRLVAGARDGDSFYVNDTRTIGGSYLGDGRPFILFFEPTDPEEKLELERVLKRTSIDEIGLAAMCNRDEDHRVLAEMALWLASRLSGYVNLGGEINCPSQLPGQVFSVPYATDCGGEAKYMVLDATALGVWLSRPEFRMVK